VDDAGRARARRITRSRIVLIIVTVAMAALLVLIVVGAMRSGETPEVGRPKLPYIRPSRR
jgi:hypothetical protein